MANITVFDNASFVDTGGEVAINQTMFRLHLIHKVIPSAHLPIFRARALLQP